MHNIKLFISYKQHCWDTFRNMYYLTNDKVTLFVSREKSKSVEKSNFLLSFVLRPLLSMSMARWFVLLKRAMYCKVRNSVRSIIERPFTINEVDEMISTANVLRCSNWFYREEEPSRLDRVIDLNFCFCAVFRIIILRIILIMSLMYRISELLWIIMRESWENYHKYNNDIDILLKYQDKIKDLIFFYIIFSKNIIWNFNFYNYSAYKIK